LAEFRIEAVTPELRLVVEMLPVREAPPRHVVLYNTIEGALNRCRADRVTDLAGDKGRTGRGRALLNIPVTNAVSWVGITLVTLLSILGSGTCENPRSPFRR
jgi:hypothetical protein